MATNTVTIEGNLTKDPELTFTPSGQAVANFTVAHTPRRFDKDRNEWVDGVTVFLDSAIWGKKAETFAETFRKGNTVLVQGNLTQQNWDDKQSGAKRSKVVLNVETVAKVERNKPSGQQQDNTNTGGW